jgi:polysaccharide export outer membrane protein
VSTTILILFSSIISMVAASDSVTTFSERDARYRIKPTDVLEFQYRYTPEFNQTVTVQPDGFVNLTLVGDLKLGGLTLDEAKTAVVKRASQRLTNPELIVVLKEFEKPHFIVGGQVGNPGRFEMRGRITAMEAIAMAGGLKDLSAKHSQVLWFRRTGDDWAETKVINLKTIVRHQTEDVELRSGDMLFVPQNQISKIERFVRWSAVGVYWNPLPH